MTMYDRDSCLPLCFMNFGKINYNWYIAFVNFVVKTCHDQFVFLVTPIVGPTLIILLYLVHVDLSSLRLLLYTVSG